MAHRFCPKADNHPPHTLRFRSATTEILNPDMWSRDFRLPPMMTAVCNGVRTEEKEET